MPKSGRAKSPRKGEKTEPGNRQVTKKESERDDQYTFKILSESQIKSLLEQDIDEVQRSMIDIMSFHGSDTNLLEASQLDYYVGALWWAKEQAFSVVQTSAFFTAAHFLLMNVKEKRKSLADNFMDMHSMFSGTGLLGADSAAGVLDCFDVQQGKRIAQYFTSVLFQHYRLYTFMFSHTQAEEVIGLDLKCELVKPASVPYPAPLDEGLPEEVWEKYVKVRQPTPAAPVQGEVLLSQTEDQHQSEVLTDKEAHQAKEQALLQQMSQEQIEFVVEMVTKDVFKNLNVEMAMKLRERENTILGRINKIHKVA